MWNAEKNSLVDPWGRKIRKLRVSLLDACNFRCFYCMPEDVQFKRQKNRLSPEQIESICAELNHYGLEQIRLTGGEPTLRSDFEDIVDRLSGLGIKKLGVTTNGFFLQEKLEFLKNTRCQNINLSLDSLNERKFEKITKRANSYRKVFSSILKAKELGMNVKLNTVLMRGINDNEIEKFVQFSERHQIEVRFLEVMRIGQACGVQDDLFISAAEAIGKIRQLKELRAEVVDFDSTSFNFSTPEGGQIGFIASESKPFCSSCSRWRLSAEGFLRACLMSDKGINLRDVPKEEYPALLAELLVMKPYHRIEEVHQDMNEIGG